MFMMSCGLSRWSTSWKTINPSLDVEKSQSLEDALKDNWGTEAPSHPPELKLDQGPASEIRPSAQQPLAVLSSRRSVQHPGKIISLSVCHSRHMLEDLYLRSCHARGTCLCSLQVLVPRCLHVYVKHQQGLMTHLLASVMIHIASNQVKFKIL